MNNYNFKLKNTLWAFIVTILLFTSSFTSAFNAPSVTITKPAFDPNAPSSKEILNIPVGVADMDALKAKGEPGEETGIYTWAPVTTPNQMNPAFGADNGTPTANTCAFRGDYAGTYTVKVSYKEGADGATVEDTSSGVIHVVKVADIEYKHLATPTWTTGDPSLATGNYITLRPKPFPDVASWPAGYPKWELTQSPDDSTVVAPSDGEASDTVVLDKDGIYSFKVTCGTSIEYINVEAKSTAINISAYEENDPSSNLQFDILEGNTYYCKATLDGGPDVGGHVVFSTHNPMGTLVFMELVDNLTRTTWTTNHVAFDIPGADQSANPPVSGHWNVPTFMGVDVKANYVTLDQDRHDTVNHREKELDLTSSGWVPDGLMENWNWLGGLAAGTPMTYFTTLLVTSSVNYTQTVGGGIESEAEGVLKAQMNLSHSFGEEYAVGVGQGTQITTTVPPTPAGEFYGIFTNKSKDYKICPVTKWASDGTSSSGGTVKVVRENALCRVGAESATTAVGTNALFPVYNDPDPIPVP